ncbi:hypothetical protein A6B43_03100 [Vespertiliibacter pulmonis]|uniref:DUF5067 domain-containing protein n=1 Tax=Vespertiliibacter pulmonis TaxID=1443036 RepID=A0A3N4VS22_9PAST|nr:hypothetical protein [Vespertiliibacter pulmonis]QLB20586.1 hypothetical protein A6B43_03100 [Vespertiliibacter pulmonis]RPE82719.1 hypothetical protein EDC46_1390 [Vespertiliibacter pulmonis]
MKLFKSLLMLSLSAVIAMSASAETNTHNKQQKQSTHKAQKQSTQKPVKAVNSSAKANTNKKAVPVADTGERELKRFTDSLELKFVGVETKEVNNEKVVSFNYSLKNKSKNTMKKVHWATILIFNQQPILILDEPIAFGGGFKAGSALPISYTIPFSQLPQVAQQVLSDPKNKFTIQFQAKEIDFTNGKKIIVK